MTALKGDRVIIAAACNGMDIAPYFAQASSFMVYTIERGVITDSRNLPVIGLSPKQLTELLDTIDAETLLVGRIECDIANALCKSGIEVVAGAEGTAADLVKAYLSHTLTGVANACFICLGDDEWDDEDEDADTSKNPCDRA